MRKRTVFTAGLFALIFGFLLGTIFPQDHLPWSVESFVQTPAPVQPAALFTDGSAAGNSSAAQADQSGAKSAQSQELNLKENFPLLNSACAVVRALQQRDYAALSGFVHPERGLTLTPYSTVSLADDLTFTAAQVKAFDQDASRYIWGVVAGTGELLQMTAEEFFTGYIFNVDYTQAARIGIDRVNISGNALENVAEAYPDCRFVDFTYPGSDAANQGQDWSSLKLVFAPLDGQWRLVGLIHSQWTA